MRRFINQVIENKINDPNISDEESEILSSFNSEFNSMGGRFIKFFLFSFVSIFIISFIVITRTMFSSPFGGGSTNTTDYFKIGLLVVIPLILIISIISTYNSLVRARNAVEEKFASMDIYLTKRHDLIPNIVRVVKGYAKHEQDTLIEVLEARKVVLNANNSEEKVKDENKLTRGITNLLAIAESYPDLKSDKQFIMLQEKLHNIEDEIANSRRHYNVSVKKFNNLIQTFPSNMFAKIFKFKKRDMFIVGNKKQRENVEIEL